MSDLHDLALLVRSRYPFVVIDAAEEARVQGVLQRTAADLDLPLFEWSLTGGLRHSAAERPLYDTREAGKALASIASLDQEGLFWLRDLPAFLEDPVVIRQLLDLVEPFARDRRAMVLAGPALRLPSPLRPYAARYRLALPDRHALAAVAATFLADARTRHGVEVSLSVARRERVTQALLGLTEFEAERILAQVVLGDGELGEDDLETIHELRRQRLCGEGILELVPARESVALCGLVNLRAWLDKRAAAWRPGAREFGLEPPRGVMLLGVQGCGKSLAARTVAHRWELPLLQLHFGRVFDKFIGESEARLEQALHDAERLAPCVLFVDEIEKALAGDRAHGDGGVARRLVGRLLGWLQDRTAEVFVVATCNRIDELPPELVRKGRFDELFFIDLPDRQERREILEAHLRRRDRDPADFELLQLAAATAGFSGAEIEQAVVAGLYSAFAEGTDLASRHVLTEIRTTVPLSRTRAEEIDALRAWARNRAVPAGADSRAA